MEEDIKILEEFLNKPVRFEEKNKITNKEIQAIQNLIARYKELEDKFSYYKEIDSKEASDALHMLLHCALKDKKYETQKEQFEIVMAYIKELEKENQSYKDYYGTPPCYDNANYISKSKVKEKIEELEQDVKDFEEYWSKDPRRFKRQKCIDYYKLEALKELLED